MRLLYERMVKIEKSVLGWLISIIHVYILLFQEQCVPSRKVMELEVQRKELASK